MNSTTYPSYVDENREHGTGPDCWAPKVTGTWGTDTAQGKTYADEAIQCIRNAGNPTALAHTVKAMVSKASWTGVEVGFFHRISEVLIQAHSQPDDMPNVIGTRCSADNEKGQLSRVP